jgi:uncharacterized protein (DUF305 family)
MSPRIVYCRRRLWIVGLIAVLSAVAFAQMEPSATSFMLVLNESMDGMDKGMKSAPMNGDVDHDFATMMMPHHQQSEIQAMQLWLSKRPNAIPAENKTCANERTADTGQ